LAGGVFQQVDTVFDRAAVSAAECALTCTVADVSAGSW
jgi:hypothetical protein